MFLTYEYGSDGEDINLNHYYFLDSSGQLVDGRCFQQHLPDKSCRHINSSMDIPCNSGIATTSMVGDLPGYKTIRSNSEVVGNIFSLSKVIGSFKVPFDINDRKMLNTGMCVDKPWGGVKFVC